MSGAWQPVMCCACAVPVPVQPTWPSCPTAGTPSLRACRYLAARCLYVPLGHMGGLNRTLGATYAMLLATVPAYAALMALLITAVPGVL